MFKHKYRFIFLIVILMALTLSAVAAHDNSTNTPLGDNINITSGNYADLGDAIYYANDSDVISVEGEYVKDVYSINIEKSVTIQSEKGAVIDANNTNELFSIYSCDVTFKNINFINAPYESIYLTNSNLTLINCTLINGGIRFDTGSLSIINSTFTGSRINTYSSSEYGDLNIENSEFYSTDFSMLIPRDFINVNICDCVFIDRTGNPFNLNCQVFNFKNNFITSCPIETRSIKANITGNTFKNITGTFRLTSEDLTFADNNLENLTNEITVECDRITFANDTFKDTGEFYLKSNVTTILDSKIINVNGISFIHSDSIEISGSELSNASTFRAFDCNVTVRDSKINNNTVIETFGSIGYCEISNCTITDSASRPIDVLARKSVLKNTRYMNCNETFYGIGELEVYSCEFINSYGFICGVNTIIKDSIFANSPNGCSIIAGNNNNKFFMMDNCSLINLSDIYLDLYCERAIITNSTIRNVSADEFIIRSSSPSLLIRDNEFAVSSAVPTMIYVTDKAFFEVDVKITHNIFAYAPGAKPYFIFRTSTDFETCSWDEYLIQENILLKDNFYGFNIRNETQIPSLSQYGQYIKASWINLDFVDLGNNNYQLKFTDNSGNIVALKDYAFSIKDKKTSNIILSDIMVKNGVGNFTCDRQITLDDIYIINSAGSAVNKPKANLTIYTTGSYLDDTEIHFRICDENGTPIPNAEYRAYLYYDRYFVGFKSSDVEISAVNSNGECILDREWKYPEGAIYSFELTYWDANHDYTICKLTNLTLAKAQATITANDFVTSYKSGKMPTVKAISKTTKKAVDYFNGRMKVYKGSKLVAYEDFETHYGIADFYGKISLKPGTYSAVIIPDNNYNYFTATQKKFKITVNKLKTTVKAPKVTAKYKKSKYFKVTVKYNKKALKNIKVKVKVYTGKKTKTYTLKTDKNGAVKINTKTLKKGSHNVVISSGSDIYSISAKSKITIK